MILQKLHIREESGSRVTWKNALSQSDKNYLRYVVLFCTWLNIHGSYILVMLFFFDSGPILGL